MDVKSIQQRGASIAVQFFNDGDFGPIQRIVDDVNSKDLKRRGAGHVALNACLITLARTLADTRRHGVTFTGPPLTTDSDLIYAIESGRSVGPLGTQLVSAVHAVRQAKPGIRASLPREDAPQPAAPMPVQVVSMPNRKTVSDINRNSAGEITSTMQIESDF